MASRRRTSKRRLSRRRASKRRFGNSKSPRRSLNKSRFNYAMSKLSNNKKFVMAGIVASTLVLNQVNKYMRTKDYKYEPFKQGMICDTYNNHISTLISVLNKKNINVDTVLQDNPIPEHSLDTSYICARHFFEINKKNKIYNMSSTKIRYYAEYNGTGTYIAEGTCFLNNKIVNAYICNNKQTNTETYRFGLPCSMNMSNKDIFNTIYSKLVDIQKTRNIQKIKKLICISLLSPCNTLSCKTVNIFSGLVPRRSAEAVEESDIINLEADSFKNNANNIFVSVPMSNNYNIIPLFDSSLKIQNNETNKNYENLVDVTTPENVFKSIVRIAEYYYNNHKNDYILCYHCKSGKDRTSVCDAIVQATFDYIKKHKTIDFDIIKNDCRYYLLYGYIITFYSTGIPGIKMSNLPVASYILNRTDFKCFAGNCKAS